MKEWQEEEDVFDSPGTENRQGLLELFGKLLAHWYWFVLCGTIGLAVAYFQLRYSTPIYQINARVLVTDGQQGGAGAVAQGAFSGDINSLFGKSSSVENEAEVLKTRYLMEQVVAARNAQVTYFLPGRIRDMETNSPPVRLILLMPDSVRGGTFMLERGNADNTVRIYQEQGFSINARYGQTVVLPGIGEVLVSPDPQAGSVGSPYSVQIASFDNKVDEYMGRLSVSVNNKQVSIIDLGFSYPLPDKGEEILRTVIQEYTHNAIKKKNTIADSTIAFIENRLVYVSQELGDVEGEIQDFRQQRELADMAAQSQLLVNNSSEYVKQLAALDVQLDILDNVSAMLADDANERVLPNAVIPEDAVFTAQAAQYNALLLERDQRLLRATPDNPAVRNLNRQLNTLRADMVANLENTRSRLMITRRSLQQKAGQLSQQVREVPAIERTYLELARQQQIKQELYVYLLQKREETAISKTATTSNSTVIDPPKSARFPFSPKRNSILLTGLLIGLAVPFAAIYLRDLTNTRIESREDVTRRTPLSIIGEIRHSTSDDPLVVTPTARTAIAEQFRAVRTNLSYYLKDQKRKTILLTSSISGEGKSFVALNLAMVLAISGKKVVVMEMDLRKPKLSAKLAKKNSAGFSNYVIIPDTRPLDIAVPSGIHDNLFFISAGPIPPNPAELLLSERTPQLFDALREAFDYIIIDAPPIGLVTDAQLLAEYADLTIYLVRQHYTQKSQLAMLNDLARQKKLKQLAILVNDIKSNKRYGYGYGGYGYGYGYGYYEGEAKRNRRWKLRLPKR